MGLAQLAVFVRPPEQGSVKTRLGEALGAAQAATLYEAFVHDTLDLCARVAAAGRVDIELWATALEDPRVSAWGRRIGTVPRLQTGGNLGDRMAAAFDEGLRRYERVVIIGSDAPTLPFSLVVAAFNALDDHPISIGPANDGGYYVIGATRDVRPRFDDVRWSTETALEDTLAANQAVEVAMLPPWYDVDGPGDLAILRSHLSVHPRAAPATARCLAELDASSQR
jgi:rSAM/selenodomain-associated transferase 1